MTSFNRSDYAFSVVCEKEGCDSAVMANDEDDFNEYIAPGGIAAVQQTVGGAWACEEHAEEVGGGWVQP